MKSFVLLALLFLLAAAVVAEQSDADSMSDSATEGTESADEISSNFSDSDSDSNDDEADSDDGDEETDSDEDESSDDESESDIADSDEEEDAYFSAYNPISILTSVASYMGRSLTNRINRMKDDLIDAIKTGVSLPAQAEKKLRKKFARLCVKAAKRNDGHKGAQFTRLLCSVVRDAFTKLPPHIFTYSISGNVGVGLAGAETVLDFYKNEEALCTIVGAQFGTSYASVGAEAGMAVAWKNKKKHETLREVCDGWNGEFSVEIDLPFKFVSAGVSVEVDLDENTKKPDWSGVVQTNLVAGVGLSALPIPAGADFAITRGRYIRGKSLSRYQMIQRIIAAGSSSPILTTGLLILYYANQIRG